MAVRTPGTNFLTDTIRSRRDSFFNSLPEFSHEDTEEICQEAFLAVVRSIGTFHGKSSFQTWLLRIATNKAMDFREKSRAAKRGGGLATISLNAFDDERPIDPPSTNTPAPTPPCLVRRGSICCGRDSTGSTRRAAK